MKAFYCIIQNMLKSYVILSCFRITKMEDDPRLIIPDNYQSYFCVSEMCQLRFL